MAKKNKTQQPETRKKSTSKTAWTITTIAVIAVFIIAVGYISLNKNSSLTRETEDKNSETETPKTKVLVFDWQGEIQKELKFKVWKQKSGYTENIYKGGQVVLEISSTNDINYNLTSGENCLFSIDEYVLQTGILKEGSATIDNTTPGTSYPYNPNNLCIKLENSRFVSWDDVNPATLKVEIYEL